MSTRIPLQSGLPTLVPNFYPEKSIVDVTGQGFYMSPVVPNTFDTSDARTPATITLTLGGSAPTTGDIVGATVTMGTMVEKVTYTVLSGDTVEQIAEGLCDALNNDAVLQANGFSATVVRLVITLAQGSGVGNGATVVDASTIAGSETIAYGNSGVMAGGSGPVVPTKNFTASIGGVIITGYYGIPMDLPYNTVVAAIAAGLPII